MAHKRVKFKKHTFLTDLARYCAQKRVVAEVSYAVHRGSIVPIVHVRPEVPSHDDGDARVVPLLQRQAD